LTMMMMMLMTMIVSVYMSHCWLQPETSIICSNNVHIMSTKPNTNPNPVDVACAIVDVAPAAANTIWYTYS